MINDAVTGPIRIEAATRKDLRPMGADQRDIDTAGDERFERRIANPLAKLDRSAG